MNRVVYTVSTMNAASIDTNKISVVHTVRPDVNREFLQINVPNGWDDLVKLYNKVLTYEGKDFVYSGWNSDRNEAYWFRLLDGPSNVARFKFAKIH